MAEGLTRREEITEELALADLLNTEQKTLRECLVYLAWLDQQIAKIQKIPRGNMVDKATADLNLQKARLLAQTARRESTRIAYEYALFHAERNSFPEVKEMVPQIIREMELLPDGKGVTRPPEDEEW